jgi:hypothetical protein
VYRISSRGRPTIGGPLARILGEEPTNRSYIKRDDWSGLKWLKTVSCNNVTAVQIS